jgi:hypothetical protein
MVPGGEYDYQNVNCERQEQQRSIHDSQKEDAKATQRGQENHDGSDDGSQKGPFEMIS